MIEKESFKSARSICNIKCYMYGVRFRLIFLYDRSIFFSPFSFFVSQKSSAVKGFESSGKFHRRCNYRWWFFSSFARLNWKSNRNNCKCNKSNIFHSKSYNLFNNDTRTLKTTNPTQKRSNVPSSYNHKEKDPSSIYVGSIALQIRFQIRKKTTPISHCRSLRSSIN